MRMKSVVLGLAACVTAVLLGGSPAKAGTTAVTSDSGSLSTFTVTNEGVTGSGVGAVTTLKIVLTTPANESLADINGSPITPIAAAFTTTETLTLTNDGFGLYTVASGNYTKTFGSGSVATLTYNLNGNPIASGGTLGGNSFDGTLNLSGTVTGVTANSLPGYDFSAFDNGLGVINLTLTGETFSGTGTHTFASVIATDGATVSGSGSFSEASAVPEPASVALLGIGMAGFFAYRRLCKRTANA